MEEYVVDRPFWKVYLTDYDHPNFDIVEKALASVGARLYYTQSRTEDEVIANCADADGLLVSYAPITKRVLESLPNVLVAVRLGIGYETFDLEGATKTGVYLANVPDYCLDEVADLTMALILSKARKLPLLMDLARRGVWDYKPAAPVHRLRAMTLGLVGFGHIAREVAVRAKSFGMRVLAHDVNVAPSAMQSVGVIPADLETVLKESDFVSLHVPLNEKTRGLISARELALMKPTAYLINTARGPVVDQEALVEAVRSRRVAGAALDVVSVEPPRPDEPVLHTEGIDVTPHAGWFSVEAMQTMHQLAAEEFARVFRGQPPRSLLNKDIQDARASQVVAARTLAG